jgi:hypothetical protein
MLTDEKAVREISGLELKLAFTQAMLAQHREQDDRATPESIPPGRLSLATANIKYLSSLIQQIVQLHHAEEADEFGILRATKYAFDAACGLLIDAAIVSAAERQKIPYGCVSTDSAGGVRIEWATATASVRLAVPSSEEKQGYVYHEEGTTYGTEAATPEALARWLRTIKE